MPGIGNYIGIGKNRDGNSSGTPAGMVALRDSSGILIRDSNNEIIYVII